MTHVAFEFQTGAGWAGRIDWQAAQLVHLAKGAGRPLHLLVRAAGADVLPDLITAFGEITVLDTTSFMKAVYRQRGIETASGKIDWETSLTAPNAPVDELLTHNWSLVSRSYDPVFATAPVMRAAE